MKTIEELLYELNHLKIKLWVENKQLRYKAPKNTLTPSLRSELTERKAEIITFISEQQEGMLPPIVPIPREGPLPLSYAQQRLWFLNQLEGEQQATYNMPAAVRLAGDLNIAALEQSLREIVQRHETLRTTFPSEDGEPWVQISASHYQLPVIHLATLPDEKQATEVQKLADKEAKCPFNLSNGPLFRTTLLQLHLDVHVLLVTMHHIISDGWSVSVLIHELLTLYEAFSTGQPSPLPPLSIQYIDFAYWQRQWLTHADLEQQLNYWRQQLTGSPALLALPTDYPRPAIKSFQGNAQTFEISQLMTQQLIEISEQYHATLFMTLLTAFVTLLNRYSGQEDIAVGTPIANRDHSEIEPLIGFFVNTLVLRTRLSGNPRFTELLAQVEKTCIDAYEHQDLPFEQLVETLHPERNLSHTPLFQVMFVLQNTPTEPLQLSRLTTSYLPLTHITAKFDLTLSLEETPQGLVGELEYSTDLFKAETIKRMIGHFQTLLASIIAQPTQSIAFLPLLTAAEKQQLLVEWNNTFTGYPQEQCLHQLFEAQVERTPNAIAVLFEEQQLSYASLNQKANQLAHYLQTFNVKPEVLVGICVKRSLEMIVGILGILKAGGAYVPLDPSYPQERLVFLLNDAKVSVLLVLEKTVHALPSHQTPLIFLDSDWDSISQYPDHNPLTSVTPNNLAYVIYTSGSTGKPKGVLVTHYNVTRLFAATFSWFQFHEQDVWTLFHSYAFDFSVWELWGALLYGGRLVVVPYWISRSPDAFYELLGTQGVTVLNQTPSAFHQLIQAEARLGVSDKLRLRLVIFGGEALEFQSLKPWFERHGDNKPQLVNMYGITETTVHVTYHPLTRVDLNKLGSVIGKPIPDLQAYLFDHYLQLLPIGIPGELYIGGAGLARGYLNHPELSANRFVPNPFNGAGSCLYRTGDLARYLPDGQLEYLGRIDNQVKILGFRIELGEIENILMKHPNVEETAITIKTDFEHHQSLVAYVIPNQTTVLTPHKLRQYLKEQLPGYMIPATFVMLDKLPLTAHGKIDYRALPPPASARSELSTVFVAPSTLEEEVLANIWSEVLEIEPVGRYENFFDLGGDSILSIKVLTQIKEAGFDLSLQQLFQVQTLHELAQIIRQTEKSSLLALPKTQAFSLISEEERHKLPAAVEDVYPLSALQAGMIFHSHYSPETVSVYHDVFSYYLKVPFEVQRLYQAIQQVVDLHPILRTSFALTTFKEPVQLVHQTIDIPFAVADLFSLSNAEQEAALQVWITEEKKHPFDWHHPPLWRLQIHRRSVNTFNLTFSFHHAIFDGWSVASLMTELLQRYLSLLGQEILPPPVPAIDFRDFIALERLTLQSEEARQFWFNTLTDFTILKLPRWPVFYRTHQVNEVGVLEIPLAKEISNGLKQLAKSLNVPIRSVLLAAHLRVLSVLSNQTDIITGLVSNGRPEDKDGERVLGLFLNTLPFRLTMPGGTWKELVIETFKMEQAVLPYRRFPLAEIQRMLGGQTLFETAFNFIHFHVYQNILGLTGVEALGGQFFEQTHFTLSTSFRLDLITHDIQLTLSYDTSELCEEQIQAIAGYYTAALTAMATNASERYECHSLLSESEQQKLLVEWNNTVTDYPKNQCIHQLFEAQVENTPDAIALIFESQQLTYRELNTTANLVAHYLQSIGVKPEVLVGICVERSIEMIIGVLAILKAGGAYVPLDPSYPQERLAFMLEDSQVPVLLTQEKLKAKLPEANTQILCLDSDWEIISKTGKENPNNGVMPNNLAYVIYTSGSTGKPKGVLLEHRGLCNLAHAQIHMFGTQSDSRILQFASLSFDASTWEFVMSLCSGAQLCLASSEALLPGSTLVKLLYEQAITHLTLPPSALAVLPKEDLLDLQYLIVAGEACPSDSVTQWSKGRHFFNAYGPTESTVCATAGECSPGQQNQPIGCPIANTQVYILDHSHYLVPIGVSGELYLSGVSQARGYLNRPGLTAEKFFPNPFSNKPNTRIYKTGDLARYLPDGNIEFMGRIDNQVKIRGFRIELGEIEAILAQYEAVRESIVIVHEVSPNDKRLVAYLVPHPEKTIDNSELRRFLSKRLPDYMMPSAFVQLEAMPLTPNGKIDRRVLSKNKELSYQSPEKTFVAPRTPEEEILANIWASILGVERVSIFDNFFELGGHSLLATQLILQIRETFAVEIPLQYLFESPTIAEFAQAIQMNEMKNPVIDINREAVLDSTIQPLTISLERRERFATPKSILLTGATGFLGAYLLYELLQQTTANLYCLVRCSNADDGQRRLRNTLESYSLWNDTFCSRIIPVAGDLSKPQLGMPEAEFHSLANQIDVIYHNGAWVHHVYSYSILKAVNVNGTQEVLKLAGINQVKPVHFMSTLGVFFSKADVGIKLNRVNESDFIADGQVLDENGYVQSKWVAEQLVRQAGERGLPVCIYRLARIAGHSQTGFSNSSDFLNLAIKGCIQLGQVPFLDDIEENITPVDYVSRAIVHLSQQPQLLGKTFHLINPQPLLLSDLVQWIRFLGYPLAQVSYTQWRTELSHQSENVLYPLLSLFPQEHHEDSLPQTVTVPQFDGQKTFEALANSELVCPSANAELFHLYFSHFWQSGF
jgi:amino acid adenylation domain-containing protein/thioester reductase-like protein